MPKDAIEYLQSEDLSPEEASMDFQEDSLSSHDDIEIKIPELDKARAFLCTGHLYEGLLRKIHAAATLSPRKGHIIDTIHNTILESLSTSVSLTGHRHKRPELDVVAFNVEWNPRLFFQMQYQGSVIPRIGSVIALTGSAIDAQAMPCRDYIHQSWPGIRDDVLDALQSTLDSQESEHDCILHDNTRFKIKFIGTSTIIEVNGSPLAIADIGEILSWLCAACQSSPHPERLAISTPRIQDITISERCFRIWCRFTSLTKTERTAQGTCWHSLFRNPVIVRGFPILAGDNDERGLEITIDMMALLGEAERATMFDNHLLIKGFSTMFVPVGRIENSVLWHLLFNADNSRMPYREAKKLCPIRATRDQANLSSLASARHFLGWASSINVYTGSNSINYGDIRFTGSNLASAGCVLEKLSLSAGSYIMIGASIMPGKKDKMLSLSTSGPYQCKIHSASQMHVVMYHVETRRAWLINGAEALMHLTRAQVSRKPYNADPRILANFPRTVPSQGSGAALGALNEILMDDYIIYEDSPGPKGRLKDVVLQNWHLLEQMQDYQIEVTGSGMPIRLSDRDRLEGFGFLDIISGKPSIPPRVATLEPSGRGWVDFTRQIAAVTLMARRFGDLILPNGKSNVLCSSWNTVPKGMDYLVARTSQLQEICDERGDAKSKPLELVQGLYWHQGGELFQSCSNVRCTSRCDLGQVLLPKHSIGAKTPDPFHGDLNGAVIFGKSSRIAKWWPRNPKIAPMDTEAECFAEIIDGISHRKFT
ncbi:hypothetical protein D0Z07_0865 [Hyphodiscus hymeniophilus]|uniref:Uncharacterized protein n=1 Tax=Hyphodiscus hymeniophilus TaxID=353542 RepID=A0A9P7B040_9HELO|nr:hypothetical protein D0Z07_0865 [Hyphodiscus hymeniophilus]